jgi:ribose/xylose/arabinose/galactoside ABC-type transport system permease subunit
MHDVGGVFGGAMVMMLAGLLAGTINVYAVAYLRMNAFVVTLSMDAMSLGIAVWITNSVGIAVSDKSFLTLVNGKSSAFPIMSSFGSSLPSC